MIDYAEKLNLGLLSCRVENRQQAPKDKATLALIKSWWGSNSAEVGFICYFCMVHRSKVIRRIFWFNLSNLKLTGFGISGALGGLEDKFIIINFQKKFYITLSEWVMKIENTKRKDNLKSKLTYKHKGIDKSKW